MSSCAAAEDEDGRCRLGGCAVAIYCRPCVRWWCPEEGRGESVEEEMIVGNKKG